MNNAERINNAALGAVYKYREHHQLYTSFGCDIYIGGYIKHVVDGDNVFGVLGEYLLQMVGN